MAVCCPKCFDDRHLNRNFFSFDYIDRGTCSYCGSLDQPVLAPTVLRDSFELLLGAYRQDDSGFPLLEWFRRDWRLFVNVELSESRASDLLEAIYEDSDVIQHTFVPVLSEETQAVDQWEEFRHELMFRNRFFPANILNPERLGELLGYLLLHESEYSSLWFRARIQMDDKPYEAQEMGAPPARLATHGRANPAGIPYLYVASTAATAVSEVRPHTGEVATVAEFTIPDGLQVLDLRHPRTTVSPFEVADETAVSLLRSDIALLERLGQELTRPVLSKSVATDYVPSQFLCEFIKKADYSGVIYPSSVADGMNLALFDPKCAKVGSVTQHKVMRVSVEIASADSTSAAAS